jgi:hypothetical protein
VQGFELLSNHGKKGTVHELPGVPWDNYSCTLDAILQINLCLAAALPNEYCVREQAAVSKSFLRQANEAIIDFAKTWTSRSKRQTALLRDSIRNLLKGVKITINEASCLEESARCITPSWLVEVPLSLETKCEECENVGTVGGMKISGFPFWVREELSTKLRSLQNVLD